ncbi:MAG: nuclear transport factor 2 family protein [Vicinamibacterales bacterium]
MQDAQAVVTAIYSAFGRGDVAAILEALDEEVGWESWVDNSAVQAGVPWLQERHGKTGAAEFFDVIASQMRIHDFKVVSLMAGDNQVAAEIEIEFTVPATGRRERDQELHLWTLNDAGKVVRFRHYVDTAKHIRAAARQPERLDI